MRPHWWLIPLALFVWGGVLLAAAAAYGGLLVGVPYPDPTPDQAAEEAYHLHVADGVALAGLFTAAAGVAGLLPFLGGAATRRHGPSKRS